MANLILRTDFGDLDYEQQTDIPIKLNRVVDDLNDPSKRFGEFSYSFKLPKTKNNGRLFGFPDVKGRTRIFIGKTFDLQLIVDSEVIADGSIELLSFDGQDYKCSFFSKFTQLNDSMKGLKLSDINSLPIINWDFENTIISHIEANHFNSDDTTHVFPYVFYQTHFMSGATLTVPDESFMTFHYNNYFPDLSFAGKNPTYYSAYPPAFFLMTVVENLFKRIGWSFGGSFFQRPELKRIIIPFTGKPEDYQSAITGTTGNFKLNLNKMLPDTAMSDFLKSIINLFNLYFTIEPESKKINFETYDVLFTKNNPYSITNKIDFKTISISQPNANVGINFTEDNNNNLVGGNDRIYDYSNFNRFPSYTIATANSTRGITLGEELLTKKYSSGTFNNVFNKVDESKNIKLVFSPTNVINYSAINNKLFNTVTSWSNNTLSPLAVVSSIPIISVQTPFDNNDKFYSDEKTKTFAEGNNPTDQTYEGGLKLCWWLQNARYNGGITGSSNSTVSDWLYVDIATGATGSIPRSRSVRLTVCSPFKLLKPTEFNRLTSSVDSSLSDVQLAESFYLASLYYTCGLTGSTFYNATDYSLTLSSDSLYPNIYSVFHANKYRRLEYGSVLEATINIDSFDWNKMKINQCLEYDNELYQLISLKNYDPINEKASIQLLKI